MKINITGNNLDLTPAIKEYIETHLASLEKLLTKYDEASVEAHVVAGRTTKHHLHGDVYQAEIHLNIPHKSFMAKADGSDLRVVFDEAKNKLKRELTDYKNQLQDYNK